MAGKAKKHQIVIGTRGLTKRERKLVETAIDDCGMKILLLRLRGEIRESLQTKDGKAFLRHLKRRQGGEG